MSRHIITGLLAAVAVASSPASAAVDLIKNGNFSTTSTTISRQMSDANGQQFVSDWINDSGYNFIVTGDATVKANTDTQTGLLSNNYGYIALWGRNNASAADTTALNNGLYESQAAHGNYLAADGAFGVSKIYQKIDNLSVGQLYTVSFDWAGAQQYRYDGDTTEGWKVGLSTSLSNIAYQQTEDLANVSHGFTGWRTTGFTFTATSASEYLTFMAKGTPNGLPPFSLLDNVTMTAVPEPASWAMMLCGFGLLGTMLRRRTPVVSHDVA